MRVMMILAVAMALAAMARAEVVTERLAVWPRAAVAGEPAHAVVSLHNTGSNEASERVALTMGGEEIAMQLVPVAAGARVSIHLPLHLREAGGHVLSAGGLERAFEVLPAGASHEERRALARRWPRRVIYNNDGGDAIYHNDVRTYLDVSTSGLVGSHVDSIWYSTVGGFTFWHDTRAGQFIGRGVSHALINTLGKDALEVQAGFAREHGMEIMWSMRMNDTHDRVEQWQWLMPQFKRDHPEFLLGSPGIDYPYGGDCWSGLDYTHPEVRQLVFEVIEDVVRRYNIDGIELDFFRGEPYFPQQLQGNAVTQAECDLVTELVRRIHEVTVEVSRKRGRPFLLAVRVPDSMAYGKAIGIDLETWLEEGLVDIVVASGDRRYEPWERSRDLVHAHDRPVYACLPGDYLRQEREGWDSVWRGHALHAWEEGMDGIYTFNFLQHRHPLFRQMGDPEVLRGTETDYEFIAGSYWGWLNDERAYIMAVTVSPPGGPFAEELSVEMQFAPEEGHTIHYTLDGSEPGESSPVYTEPVSITGSTVLRARTRSPSGLWTPVMTERYDQVAHRHAPAEGTFPLDFFGTPKGHEMALSIDVPEIPEGSKAYLYLTMMDVDAPAEALFFVNGNGPIEPPAGVISGSMTLSDTIEVPASHFRPGPNEVRFRFDNLNEGTSGFIVYDCQVLVD